MSRRRRKRTKPILWVLLGIVCVLILVAAYFVASMYSEYNSRGVNKGDKVTIEIEQGEGTRAIAEKLKAEGLIKYKSVFFLKIRDMGVAGKLRYGSFTFYKEAGLELIIESLISGGALKEEAMFTVPEGYTIEQIAVKLESEGFCTSEEFLAAVEEEYDYWFLASIPENDQVRYRLQGFLYPETYAIGDEMKARDIVNVMLEQFEEIYTKDMEAKAISIGKTTYEVVVEASIIERETGVDSEKDMIAGVIKNRLETGMKLQIDPTFLYPITDGLYDITKVTYEHTLIDSPYNTYQNEGLPPGPIANPALSSLEAALNPVEHDYLFYHTDTQKNDGSHLFTKTYEEHLNTQ